jgi:hypothetical protein
LIIEFKIGDRVGTPQGVGEITGITTTADSIEYRIILDKATDTTITYSHDDVFVVREQLDKEALALAGIFDNEGPVQYLEIEYDPDCDLSLQKYVGENGGTKGTYDGGRKR